MNGNTNASSFSRAFTLVCTSLLARHSIEPISKNFESNNPKLKYKVIRVSIDAILIILPLLIGILKYE